MMKARLINVWNNVLLHLIIKRKKGQPCLKHTAYKDAKKAGKTKYIGGTCTNCGGKLRYVSSRECVDCCKKKGKERYHRTKNTDAFKENLKKDQKKNNQTEKRKAYMRKYMKDYHAKQKEQGE